MFNPSFTLQPSFCVLLFDGIVYCIVFIDYSRKIKIHFYTICLFAVHVYVFVFFSQSILIFWGRKCTPDNLSLLPAVIIDFLMVHLIVFILLLLFCALFRIVMIWLGSKYFISLSFSNMHRWHV